MKFSVKFAIQHPNGTFYSHFHSTSGPMFGYDLPRARKFSSRVQAEQHMAETPLEFEGCSIVTATARNFELTRLTIHHV